MDLLDHEIAGSGTDNGPRQPGDTEEDLVASMVTATRPLSPPWWRSLSTSPIRAEKTPYLQLFAGSSRLAPD